jgi:hypothetical protein
MTRRLLMAHRTGATMAKPKALRVPRSCLRCERQLRHKALLDAIIWLRKGRIQHVICLQCTTIEEMAEATIRAATSEIGLNRADGLVYTRAIRSDSDRKDL